MKVDAAFCYPCRKFSSRCLFQSQGRRVDQAFTLKGYRDWKHATEAKKGFLRHADSKDHLACCVMWKEKKIGQQTARKFPRYSIQMQWKGTSTIFHP